MANSRDNLFREEQLTFAGGGPNARALIFYVRSFE